MSNKKKLLLLDLAQFQRLRVLKDSLNFLRNQTLHNLKFSSKKYDKTTKIKNLGNQILKITAYEF